MAALWGLIGLCGIAYAVVVARRLRVQTTYRPVSEDWWFDVLLPLATYATLAASACMAAIWARAALFVVVAAALLLLFIGIQS
ncbi:MAG: hypothetical protein HYR85_19360 [Planctomycetes bacterium]|nr:hypothetical protein [Planctomycetota bacterium]